MTLRAHTHEDDTPMTPHAPETDMPDVRPPAEARTMPEALHAMVDKARRRIAPLWPVTHFVAVNPFLGLTALRFDDAARLMARNAGARMTMPRAFYLRALADGRIGTPDLALALARSSGKASPAPDVERFKAMLSDVPEHARPPLATVADVAGQVTGRDWAGLVREQIALCAASHFDQGQALWLSPTRHLDPYAAWLEFARIDRTPRIMGLARFHQTVRALPGTAEAMLGEGIARLGLAGCELTDYFHRLLSSMEGWAGYARYRLWQSELRGRDDTALTGLLAVRLAWEVALADAFGDEARFSDAWEGARQRLLDPDPVDPALAIDHVLQAAYEIAWQRDLLTRLSQQSGAPPVERKAVQAVFCIDVRSEVIRRALESVSGAIDTLGFAGFFGMPIEYVPLGHAQGGAQCPVLVTPTVRVRESIRSATAREQDDVIGLRHLRLRVSAAWNRFKLAAVSSLAYVETMGWTYLGKLLSDGFGFSRPVPHPATDGIDDAVANRLGPAIEPSSTDGLTSGMTLATRVELAENALRGMSLREGFARLVVLAGHAAASTNNPHASGLDCGACGGHSGEANARVAAAVFNDPRVREELARRGIRIPSDTWFVAALHITTTDEVTLFDVDAAPATHAPDLAQLGGWLRAAGARARTERAGALRLRGGRSIEAQVESRSRDWSQVRPEWGLAGCAAFVVAPRARTAGLDLGGRVFLHSYDWRQDADFAVLEAIMTAPMIVGAWINLQYYGSAVDNAAFGCGNKVLHNVVGKLGVLEGNGGNLRSGLPLQSLHDGERWIHEPLRLSVAIEAPVEAINRILTRHAGVRELADHGWIHLFALPLSDAPPLRYAGNLEWETTA